MRIRPVETSGLPMPFQRRGQGPVIVGSPDPLAWANKADGAKHAWDFIANAARWNGQYIGALANTPNWTFTRASTGYAQTSGGVLVPFASGELRRTDKGVLIEGARTNLCLQSQTFDHASWTKSSTTATADAIAAPDGTTTADLITATTGGYVGFIATASPITVSASTAYTFSLFVKASVGTDIRLRMSDTVTGQCLGQTNTATGAVSVNSSGTYSSVSVGTQTLANGWFRVWITGTQPAGQTSMLVGAYLSSNSDAHYFWGAQVE